MSAAAPYPAGVLLKPRGQQRFSVEVDDETECGVVDGGLSHLWAYLPFNGWFVVVRGGYWHTLWEWVSGKLNDEPHVEF